VQGRILKNSQASFLEKQVGLEYFACEKTQSHFRPLSYTQQKPTPVYYIRAVIGFNYQH